MKLITSYEMKNILIKFLEGLEKKLKQPESTDNSMIECSVDINRDISEFNHKLCKQEIIIRLRYEEDVK